MGAVARGIIAGAGSAVALAGIRVMLAYVTRLGDALGGTPGGPIQSVTGRGGAWIFAVISACAGVLAAAATPPATPSSRRKPTSGLEFAVVAAASAFIYFLADGAASGLR